MDVVQHVRMTSTDRRNAHVMEIFLPDQTETMVIFTLTAHQKFTFVDNACIGLVQMKMRYTPNTPLVAATAVREADKNVSEDHEFWFSLLQSALYVLYNNVKLNNNYFQDYILEASTGSPTKLTDIRYEHNPSVQSRKRLPLKMIISEMASRDINTVETEPHHSAHSHIDDASLHTAPIQNRCPGRYFIFLDYIRNLVHRWNSLNISVPTAITQC